MIKKIILLVALFLLITGVGFYYWRIFVIEKRHLNEKEYLLSVKKDVLTEMVINHSKFAAPFSFPNNFELINEDNRKMRIKDIVLNNTILVYKISKYNCINCIEAELPFLDSLYSTDTTQNKIVLFAEDYNIRELKIIKGNYKIKYPVYNINNSDFFKFLAPQKLNAPYLFVLDSTLEARTIFFPEKFLPEVSKKYYEVISNLLEERNN